jgi:hypothetical protein
MINLLFEVKYDLLAFKNLFYQMFRAFLTIYLTVNSELAAGGVVVPFLRRKSIFRVEFIEKPMKRMLYRQNMNLIFDDRMLYRQNINLILDDRMLYRQNMNLILDDRMLYRQNMNLILDDRMLYRQNMNLILNDRMLYRQNMNLILDEFL